MKLHELKQIIREEIEKELSSKSEGMKVEDLKLYGKYKYILDPNMVFIYIGIGNENYHWFLYKNEKLNLPFSKLKHYGFNPDQIVKYLNLETFIDENGKKHIKGYQLYPFKKERIETYLKPI